MLATKTLQLILGAIAIVVVAVIAFTATAPTPGLKRQQLAAETFQLTTSPDALPSNIRAALAREIGQGELHMAAAGRSFNASDVVFDNTLPYHRLVCAAVGSKHVIVQFEEGGFSPMLHTVVFQRGFWRSYTVWSGGGQLYREPKEFAAAIRDGNLWGTESDE